MKTVLIFVLVVPALALAITVLPNGNSPERKMIGGMMVDVQKGFVPMGIKSAESDHHQTSRRVTTDDTSDLPVKERYRRLIPYMTFYYANELLPKSPEKYRTIIPSREKTFVPSHTISPTGKRIGNSQYKNVPRYQGNRLTQYNIASATPYKFTQHFPYDSFRQPVKESNFVPYTREYDHEVPLNKLTTKPLLDFSQYFLNKFGGVPIPVTSKSPSNLYQVENVPSVQYYSNQEKLLEQKFRLVPYEQTPPLEVSDLKTNTEYKDYPIPVPVISNQADALYTSPRYQYEHTAMPEVTPHPRFGSRINPLYKPFVDQKLSKLGYSTLRPFASLETGFKPMTSIAASVIETRLKAGDAQQKVVTTASPDNYVSLENESHYYDYGNQQPASHTISSDARSLSNILKLLQDQNSIPHEITKENVNTSIKTLVQVLNYLKSNRKPTHYTNSVEPLLSTPAPFVAQDLHEALEGVTSPTLMKENNQAKVVNEIDSGLYDEAGHGNQYLEDVIQKPHSSSSQSFPGESPSGGTPGQPGVDYPILTTIPKTTFDCKTQRYKGFFGDTETNCQVWHYCDLNGGQASFLCPNGTIFSQAALTCDWWFNVKCDSTTQLYVLNERLYKYVLPHTPKFPEDYQGPLVDKYLTLKFKEMEEMFRKNKKKHPAMAGQEVTVPSTGAETSEASDERRSAYDTRM